MTARRGQTEQIEYVYGIVPAGPDAAGAPTGLDGRPVRKVVEGDIAALVSSLDGAEYASERIDEQATDLDWLAPRAQAHDAVITWANDPGPVVPLPMWTLFSSEPGVCGMLAARSGELRETLARIARADEYSLRVFARAAEVRASLESLAPEIAEAQRALAAAPPGQRYLLERKLEAQKKELLRSAAENVAARVYDEVRAAAVDSVLEPLPRASAVAEAQAVLNAVFLVRRDGFEEFRRRVSEAVAAHKDRGFYFEFTGPWPAYHFVSRAPG
ncbi:MAG: GvpL/GvpF family gas vesicle protein [Gemmatimonadaceae bacterium]